MHFRLLGRAFQLRLYSGMVRSAALCRRKCGRNRQRRAARLRSRGRVRRIQQGGRKKGALLHAKRVGECRQSSGSDLGRARGQAHEILQRLGRAGDRGCLNTELWDICHAVNSRIADLRKCGHQITAACEGRGMWRYRLIEPTPSPAPPPDPHKPTTLPLFGGARE